jgi:hypothetical protein
MRFFLTILAVALFIISCQKEIHFDSDTPGNGPPPDTTLHEAVYTLINTPNDCMIDSLAGVYVKGIQIDSSVCKIFIGVNVTKAGTYSITTEEKNGYSFTGGGVFETTGDQFLVLNAQGKPVANEQDAFNITAGSSSCSFAIEVLDAVSVNNDDYFPLTPGSYWSYEDLTPMHDTMTRSIGNIETVNGLEYAVMKEQRKGAPHLYNFRKSPGGEYFEYASVDEYAAALSYVPTVSDEIYFMNNYLLKATSWETPDFTGTISSGQPILLKYTFTCLQKDATVVLNGKAFTNVYVLNIQPQIRSVDHAYNSTGEDYYYYYAKGIGIIYMIKYDLGRRQSEWRIKAWDVK